MNTVRGIIQDIYRDDYQIQLGYYKIMIVFIKDMHEGVQRPAVYYNYENVWEWAGIHIHLVVLVEAYLMLCLQQLHGLFLSQSCLNTCW